MKALSINYLIPEPPTEWFLRNSYLSTVYRALTGQPQFMGNEDYLKFGNELHKRDLQPHLEKEKFSPEQEKLLKAMLKCLAQDKEWQSLKKGANLEKISWIEIDGVLIRGTIDVDKYKVKHGEDLKSTSCRSEQDFLEASRKYGYFRQGWIYSQMEKYKSFGFSGAQKVLKDPKKYRFVIQDYPDLLKEGKEQARMLIDAFKIFYKEGIYESPNFIN